MGECVDEITKLTYKTIQTSELQQKLIAKVYLLCRFSICDDIQNFLNSVQKWRTPFSTLRGQLHLSSMPQGYFLVSRI